MDEWFGKDYYYGKKQSNYLDYEQMDSRRKFATFINFAKENGGGGSLLDVGCAFGYLLREFAHYYNKLYGFDVSGFAISKAKKIVPNADIRILSLGDKLPYRKSQFDCVAAMDVLEHTYDFDASFNKLVPLIKQGGFLMVSVPLNEWPRKLFGFLDKDPTHISIPTEKSLAELVWKNGLEIVRWSYFNNVFLKPSRLPIEIEIILRK